ncbi:MAG: hypothetical protein JW969_14865 [Spirochaetales bacterium]|nr:hypothetical protein [Spirochaetales bacterium]
MISSYHKTGELDLPSNFDYWKILDCPITFDILLSYPLYYFNPYNYPLKEVVRPF